MRRRDEVLLIVASGSFGLSLIHFGTTSARYLMHDSLFTMNK